MELVSHTTTTVTKDKRRFKSTSPCGEVYYTTLTTKTHETNVEMPVPARDAREPARRRLRTTTRTTTRRQVHRVAPYIGARPVRISSHSNTITDVHERIVPTDDD